MKKDFRLRYTVLGIVFVIIFGLLGARLFNLQFVQGEKNLKDAQDFSQKPIRLTGARGKILDSKGLPLAYNKTDYDVQFVRNPSLRSDTDRAKYTQSIMGAMKIIEDNGGKFLSTFAIRKMPDGSFDFYWAGIDKGTQAYEDKVYDWKKKNCTNSSVTNPIRSKDTPEQIFDECLKHYYIPAGTSYEDAFKILSVWQEVNATLYSSYIPITLAENVDMNTVAKIRIEANNLFGMQISQGSTRVYPNKTMAAHIVGYLSRMSDEPTIKAMAAQGYKSDDLIGVAGIEKTEESELSGDTAERTGTRVVEVDYLGKVIREISSDNKTPKPGNNVMLTLDSGLQKITEAALAENIAQVNAAQQQQYRDNQATYDLKMQNDGIKQLKYATNGAAVVMDVQTGDVLAMASYPSYDPNVFTGGLSQADFKKFFGEGTDNPLFDNAISSRGTPGSIFKMCTGIAGLMEGVINLNTKITDNGPYIVYDKNPLTAPRCWAAPKRVGPVNGHEDQTVVEGLKNSCNFFFYTVADGLKINRLYSWAQKFGLTSPTNIELPSETTSQVGCQATLYSKDPKTGAVTMSGVAALVRNGIVAKMKAVCEYYKLHYDDDKYTATALEIMDLVNQNLDNPGPDIRAIMKNELKLTAAQILTPLPGADTNLSNDVANLLTEIMWTGSFTIEAGIGQSVTALTPIAVARYVSAVVNGGNVYDARLVKSVVTPNGDVRENPPKLVRNLGVPQQYLNAIMKGMREVVSSEEGGTAADYFKDFPEEYKNEIGGKTGTAQVNDIDIENNSWFVAFTPYTPNENDDTADPVKKPEIAVVVYIPNGYKGAMSSYTAKQIIQYYLDNKKLTNAAENMPQANSLVK